MSLSFSVQVKHIIIRTFSVFLILHNELQINLKRFSLLLSHLSATLAVFWRHFVNAAPLALGVPRARSNSVTPTKNLKLSHPLVLSICSLGLCTFYFALELIVCLSLFSSLNQGPWRQEPRLGHIALLHTHPTLQSSCWLVNDKKRFL